MFFYLTKVFDEINDKDCKKFCIKSKKTINTLSQDLINLNSELLFKQKLNFINYFNGKRIQWKIH